MKPQTRRRVPRSGSSPLAAKCLRVSSARPTSQQHRREQRAAGEGEGEGESRRLSWRNVRKRWSRARRPEATGTPQFTSVTGPQRCAVSRRAISRRPVAFSLLALAMKASGPMEGVSLQGRLLVVWRCSSRQYSAP